MTQLNPDKCIVTGALGWLGINLVEALVNGLPEHDALREPRRDLRVRCLVLPGQDPAPLRRISDRLELVAGDLRNPDDCARLCADARGAVLFHTAGVIHPRRVAEFQRNQRRRRRRICSTRPFPRASRAP